MGEKIYKYVDLKCGLLILKNNSVKASHPQDYNDPFDCSIDYDKSDITESLTLITEYFMAQEFLRIWNDKELKANKALRLAMNNDKVLLSACLKICKTSKYFDHIAGIHSLSKKILLDAEKYSEETYNTLESKFKEETINQIVDIKDNSLLSCFSKEHDSILMWSHYADKHKGICIEFERPEKDFYDVNYSKKRTIFNLEEITKRYLGYQLANEKINLNDKKFTDHILKPFKTKSLEWKYEKEVRCILSAKSEGITYNEEKDIYLYKMPTNITKIYLGCKIDKDSDDYKELVELCKHKIEMIELSQSNTEFKLV